MARPPVTARRWALVYAGAGTSPRCVAALLASLRRLQGRFGFVVRTVQAASLRDPAWRARTALLCMPGGRDLPYLRALRGAANAQIRAYVHGGGAFFGSCAGAYYACHELAFAAARVPAVRGPRPLRLLAARAQGPSQAADHFAYGEGAAAGRRQLCLRALAALRLRSALSWQVFNQGGCVLRPLRGRSWRRHERPLLATRSDDPTLCPANRGAAVAVAAACGRGRVLLCGAHPERTAWLSQAGGPKQSGPQAMAALLGHWLCGICGVRTSAASCT